MTSHASLSPAARLLGRSHDDITAAIDEGEIETIATAGGPMIDIREIAEQALHVWPLVTIEEALGTDASLILPPGVRTRRFSARLPRYIIAARSASRRRTGRASKCFSRANCTA